jgi:dTDP-glucose pyrophosphorylase
MRKKYSHVIVDKDDSILFVLKKMDASKHKLMIVLKANKFFSVISIGDIQRAIIKNVDLKSPIYQILRKKVHFASTKDNISQLKERMKLRRNELMPVVSTDGELEDVIFWEDLFAEKLSPKEKQNLGLPVIIMAGGKGTRLKPLTNVLPKPLIPLNNKTIIEDIMDRFLECGCNKFYISVNYKAEIIKYYLNSLHNEEYQIEYIQEDNPLGTAGSLGLLKDKINSTFFVTNCDIIVEQDYLDVLNYHRENKNEITIVAALKTYPIPYGTLKTLEDGLLKSIQEKPEYVCKINTGFYILEPHLLNEIPSNKFYHITSLIEKLLHENRPIGVFPVGNSSWIDVGNWDEYYSYIRTNHE